jgi:hypothetical protein
MNQTCTFWIACSLLGACAEPEAAPRVDFYLRYEATANRTVAYVKSSRSTLTVPASTHEPYPNLQFDSGTTPRAPLAVDGPSLAFLRNIVSGTFIYRNTTGPSNDTEGFAVIPSSVDLPVEFEALSRERESEIHWVGGPVKEGEAVELVLFAYDRQDQDRPITSYRETQPGAVTVHVDLRPIARQLSQSKLRVQLRRERNTTFPTKDASGRWMNVWASYFSALREVPLR